MLRLFLFCLTLALASGQTNYCQQGLCRNGTQHIACNNNGTFSSACPTSPAPFLVNMNQALLERMVAAHNARRNRLALGNLPGFDPARRMAYMRWNDELAFLAELNVLQCVRNKDACHNTLRFRNSGQNIALFEYDGTVTPRSNLFLMVQAVSNWWGERDFANRAEMNSFPNNSAPFESFALMAQQRNIALGCAAARFLSNGLNRFLLACNYAVNNVVGRPVYVAGPTAAGCVTGTNVGYPGLCRFAEDFNI